MSRRDKKLGAYLLAMQEGRAGATEDPFAGVPPELAEAHLYATSAPRSGGWGFDGTIGSSSRIQVHRDGHGTAHTGACAVEVDHDPRELLIRQACMDSAEAAVWRAMCADPTAGTDTIAAMLGISLRTCQRRQQALWKLLAALKVDMERARRAP